MVRVEFPGSGQAPGQASAHGITGPQEDLDTRFDERLAVFHHQNLVALRRQRKDLLLGQRILRNLQHRNTLRMAFAHIVVTDAGRHHAQPLLRGKRQGGIGRLLRTAQQLGGLRHQRGILPFGIARQQYPAGTFLIGGKCILVPAVPYRHRGTRVRQAGDQPHQHRQTEFFRQVKGVGHHIVAFLLRRGLQYRNHGKFSIKAGILFVLRGVHGRIVGRHHHQTALHARDGGVDKGIGADIHSHMLHTNQRAFPGERHAQRRFHGGFFVGAPTAVQAAFTGDRVRLDEFGYLGRRRAGIGIHPGQSSVNGSQRKGFITQQQSFHLPVKSI